MISANLNSNFEPNGNGIVTAINAKTLAVIGTVTTGGTNSTAGAIGPDGNLYVVNTGDFVNPGSMTVINPTTLAVISNVANVGVGPRRHRDRQQRARLHFQLLRRHGHLEHQSARVSSGDRITRSARRSVAVDAAAPSTHARTRPAMCTRSSSEARARVSIPYVFVYKAGTYALTDSITVGPGPSAIRIATF